MDEQAGNPHYFIFSDDPHAARERLILPENRVTFVNHNQGNASAYADLWLMTQCRHFITANSTFSWWGAWLGSWKGKIIMTPKIKIEGLTTWGFAGLIPSDWRQV